MSPVLRGHVALSTTLRFTCRSGRQCTACAGSIACTCSSILTSDGRCLLHHSRMIYSQKRIYSFMRALDMPEATKYTRLKHVKTLPLCGWRNYQSSASVAAWARAASSCKPRGWLPDFAAAVPVTEVAAGRRGSGRQVHNVCSQGGRSHLTPFPALFVARPSRFSRQAELGSRSCRMDARLPSRLRHW